MSGSDRRTIGLTALPEETILALTVNGRSLTRLSCSPFDREELVIGWLFTQGIIVHPEELTGIAVGTCERARIGLSPPALARLQTYHPFRSSGCGEGAAEDRSLDEIESMPSSLSVSPDMLVRLMRRLIDGAERFAEHGGIHGAMLADPEAETPLVLREDIGRANAVDKVIGWGFRTQINFTKTVLLTTGRLSSEMLLKTVRAQIPIVVSRTTLTSRTLEIAKRSGQTVAGHILKPRPILINI